MAAPSAADEIDGVIRLKSAYGMDETIARIKQDVAHAQAREWYQKAADKGHATAMFNLGLLYDNGQGVAQDYAKAREWYKKAATKGDAASRARLEKLGIR